MPLNFEIRGDQLLNNAQIVDGTLWGASQPWPDDYRIVIHFDAPAGATEIDPSYPITGLTVYTPEGDRVGDYNPRRVLSPSEMGDDYLTFNGYYFTGSEPGMFRLYNVTILGEGKTILDIGPEGLTLTPGNGQFNVPRQSVPCFGPHTVMLTQRGVKTIRDILPGDMVLCLEGWLEVLAIQCSICQVSQKSRPIIFDGVTYSPQHRILVQDRWIKAKFLVELGLAEYVHPMPATQEYWHIFLEEHGAIALGTDRFSESLLKFEGIEHELRYPEVKRKDLNGLRHSLGGSIEVSR